MTLTVYANTFTHLRTTIFIYLIIVFVRSYLNIFKFFTTIKSDEMFSDGIGQARAARAMFRK